MSFCLLPLAVFLLFLLFFLVFDEEGVYSKIRLSLVLSLIGTSATIFFYNEVLSAFDAITYKSALVFWILQCVVLFGLIAYLHRSGRIRLHKLALLGDAVLLKGIGKTNKILTITCLLFFVLPLLFLAIYAPANNFDSHSYHLNRIMFWVTNQNLDHFPTQHIFQLYLNVFAEYLVLHTVLLSGADHFAGLVQFGSFIGSLAAVSLLAKKMGMKANGQLLAGIFLLTLPIGIFESTSTQVDYVACFFFISFVYFGFDLLKKKTLSALLMMLLSLTLGGFTKYTIFIFAIPFTIYFGIRILIQYGFLFSVKTLLLAIVMMSLVFTPFFSRNYQLFGSVMSPPEGTALFAEKIPVDKHSVMFTVSGIIKNSSLHLGLPSTAYNLFVENGMKDFHKKLGMDVDDPALRLDWFRVRYSVHEDMASNTFHFILIILASLPLFFLRGKRDIKWFWICGLAGFILFCSLLKFQLWSSRTHMPFFAMGAVMVSYLYSQVLKWNITYMAVPLMLLSSVFVYGNPNKALLPLVYIAQKTIAHIPVAIYQADSAQGRILEKNVSRYYDFKTTNEWHVLKKWPDFQERRKVFALLDQCGYFEDDRSATVFATNRTKGYFLSHLEHYNSFGPLLDHINQNGKNIGVLFLNGVGFYHYQAAITERLDRPGRMEYIRYHKEFMALKNAQKDYCYDYILADDAGLIKNLIPIANIDTVYNSPLLYLVKLKKSSCERYLF
ncbi:glycosyltransferase family 39 protein [Dyadobacter psychrotolerans]|uniref:Uncharacterized protein n=1 Tax=Dyadobacter psychrotolerans TaxID=2541721 RepID=A0A4R5DER1_9BACT|nr:glycosyltransferase family 39 protein [Dyadobacter psychrotolerans]TDE11617.1 hypothetical protein E0F88_24630 [Dyadobacter psychrotolerans]